MAEFLTTNGTSYFIEKIITSAKTKLVMVSPYLSFSKTFYERLKDACSRNVNISIIFGKTELNEDQRKLLSNIKNLISVCAPDIPPSDLEQIRSRRPSRSKSIKRA